SLGGNVDLLAVGKNQDGRLEVFARGAQDKALWHIWQTSPSGDWSSWDSFGGRIDLLAVSRNQDGRLEVFARGMDDKALWHIWQTAPNNGWSGWASLGGIIDLLTVGRNQDGRLEVFARGMDLALWHIWQTAPNNGWSGWASLGGIIDLLTVGSNQDGRLEVFVRGTDKALWHVWQTAPNNGWSGWASESGVIEQLTVGSNQDGRLEVFVSGADRALWHDWQTAPNNGWSGWASLDVPMWRITDEGRGRITVYEVVQLLEFSQFRYGDSINGGTVYVPVASLPGIDKKRSIILDDAAADPETVMVQSAQQVDTDGDGQADHWLIAFTPDLTRSLSTASATMFGNVCTSSHGQTIVGEVLGDGDASQTFQSFRLQKSPVTFVHQAGAPHGVADSLQIQLAGVLWKETQDFFGHGPTERIFVTSQDAKSMTVQFGDGVTGSRLPTGRGNVVATYRQGIGVAGNVSAGALRTLLDRPVGLKSVSNPGPATGGADAETLDQTRGNAPNTVRTFGRIVSLEDFEDAAREVAGIAKAHAYSGWTGEEQVVYLTVAGVEGAAVIGNLYSDLVADLNSRRDPNRTMRVQSYNKIAVRFAATIFVSADHVVDDVLAAVQAAITGYFAFDNQQFGQPMHLSNVYAVVQGVSGVTGADITTLEYKKASDAMFHGATSDAAQMHLRIDGDELAVLEDLIDDAVITVGAPV
ncbi:MAG TPA: putative baseplate assembly protein, partial [Candidatus Angelobacter sp.]|nr:putative baseplate assembly protein [Candidatus Angelobacter sp.]